MEYTANMIAESMWAQCNIDRNQWLLMEAIIDHRANDLAVKEADGYVVINKRKHRIKITKGWELCVQWQDGTTTWQ
jgi:hypothetical protein